MKVNMEVQTMNEEQMKKRTKEFAKSIIKLCRLLPDNREGRLIENQIFRSGTSIAANYRAVCRARSTADFIAKLAIVEEEADSLPRIGQKDHLAKPLTLHILPFHDELIAIIVSSIKTSRKRK
ncbi:hypothetical protein ES703_113700 [subsurface metagenome]